MTVRIKLAETADEVDAVFRLRHQVFVEEEQMRPPQPDGRMSDRFDAYPTTSNVIAIADGEVVGTLRGAQRTSAGTPADEWFDFRPHLPAGSSDIAAGMLAVSRPYRDVPQLVIGMLGVAMYWAIDQDITHVVAPCYPLREKLFSYVGFKAVGPEFIHEHHQLAAVPMVLDLAEVDDFFLAFLRRQRIDHWLQTYERQFHQPGEYVMRRGEAGDAAYVVVEGSAEVVSGNGQRRELTRGDLFGELALLSSKPRVADIVATEPLILMVLDRDVFQRQLREHPEGAVSTLEVIATRMTELLESS
jgi:N-acyl-L-homoserine lactone synthetase